MPRRRRKRIAVVLPVFAAGVAWLVIFNGGETTTECARLLCGECGLEPAEIDRLIDGARHATLNRKGMLKLFREQFGNRKDAELCEPCAEAVLAAAKD